MLYQRVVGLPVVVAVSAPSSALFLSFRALKQPSVIHNGKLLVLAAGGGKQAVVRTVLNDRFWHTPPPGRQGAVVVDRRVCELGIHACRTRLSAPWGLAASRRQARAMLACPARRCRLIAVLRNVAMTWGPLPARTWERSSS